MRVGDIVQYVQERNGRTYPWKAIVLAMRPGFCSIFVYAWNRVVTVNSNHLWPWEEHESPAASVPTDGVA